MHGSAFYLGSEDLLARMAELDLLLQLQVEADQLSDVLPLISRMRPRLVIDHCGRPVQRAGLGQAGFQALLRLGREGRASVKLSGYAKFSNEPWPHREVWPYLEALMEAFTFDACVWASDWPYLKAKQRVDYGPLLALMASLVPDQANRRKLFMDTPRRLFAFGPA